MSRETCKLIWKSLIENMYLEKIFADLQMLTIQFFMRKNVRKLVAAGFPGETAEGENAFQTLTDLARFRDMTKL